MTGLWSVSESVCVGAAAETVLPLWYFAHVACAAAGSVHFWGLEK